MNSRLLKARTKGACTSKRSRQQIPNAHRVENIMKRHITIAAIAATAILLAGCSPDSDVASENLSKAADQFEIQRRVVFFNGITDTYLLSIEGACSITDEGNQLEVVCKTGPDEYKKHFLGLSDNVSYFVEQIDSANVSTDHYRVIFKPEVIIPDVDKD